MKLTGLFSLEELQDQLDKRMIKSTPHPTYRLAILNYTKMAQYTPEYWNHVTDKCRGLIYDPVTLEVVARPFEKFWNLNDPRHPETIAQNLPVEKPTITRKMDGSLGIGYRVDGLWSAATRGAFVSDQAIWATNWLRSSGFDLFEPGYTPLFEIIDAENQIVVHYEWEGLVLLAGIDLESGADMSRSLLESHSLRSDFRLVEEVDAPVEQLAEEDVENEEGYVAMWRFPDTPSLRVKIKYETYTMVHKLLTQTNPITVWEALRDGIDLSSLAPHAPAEFLAWLAGVGAGITSDYIAIERNALDAMLAYGDRPTELTWETRKAFAFYAVNQKGLTSILFSMLDQKDYAPIIWKMVRPQAAEQTFRREEE